MKTENCIRTVRLENEKNIDLPKNRAWEKPSVILIGHLTEIVRGGWSEANWDNFEFPYIFRPFGG